MNDPSMSMKGKTCMITGATSGIGKEAARELARLGATVVLVARNPAKGAATVEGIKKLDATATVEFLLADLSSQREIRRLAADYNARHQRLDVLVNNVGALMMSRQHSVDEIEMTFALNHLSYFLLTNLLLGVLKSSSPSRVINVSSDSHQRQNLDFQDLQCQGRYSGYRSYGKSKLANLLFTYELARRLEGSGITANALHPGLVATNFMANNGPAGRLLNLGIRLMGRSVQAGARTITYLAASTDLEGVTGQYFVDEKAVASSKSSYDREAAIRLWQVSEELTGLAIQSGA